MIRLVSFQYLKMHFTTHQEDLIPEPCYDDEALLNCHIIKDPNDPNTLTMKNNTKSKKKPAKYFLKSEISVRVAE